MITVNLFDLFDLVLRSCFLSLGFPLDGYPNTRSITALIIAIRRNDFHFVRTLVELGCDVNYSVRSYTIIPLMEAYQLCKNKRENPFLFEVNLR